MDGKRNWRKWKKTQRVQCEELFYKGAQISGTIAGKGGRINRN